MDRPIEDFSLWPQSGPEIDFSQCGQSPDCMLFIHVYNWFDFAGICLICVPVVCCLLQVYIHVSVCLSALCLIALSRLECL